MKLKIIFLLILEVSYCQAETDAVIAVVLMIKDEATVVRETLQPLIEGGIRHFLIFDTGSTDGTQQVVTDFFKQYPESTHYLIEEPFIDFSTSRNHALDQAEKLFAEIPFFLMPDAEWYLHNTPELITFCEHEKNGPHDCFLIPLHIIQCNPEKTVSLNYYIGRLTRGRKNIRFAGVVHECLNKLGTINVPDNIYFEYQPTELGRQKSAQRWYRDKELLLKSYTENPQDPRTLFYLAQTYACLGDWQNAYLFYTKRAEIAGWDEENFMTFLRLGEAAEHLESQENSTLSSDKAVAHYHHAFSMRPHRAEPLVKLANYYLKKKNMERAFQYAFQAVGIPYPEKDILFIDSPAYHFTRYNILAISAWYVKEYELGQWAAHKALKAYPNAEYLQRNLKFYQERQQ